MSIIETNISNINYIYNLSDEEIYKVYELLQKEPLLEDIMSQPNISDVDRLISYEKGEAMRINVLRFDHKQISIISILLGIIVPSDGTLKQLKQAIKDRITTEIEEILENHRISWYFLFYIKL